MIKSTAAIIIAALLLITVPATANDTTLYPVAIVGGPADGDIVQMPVNIMYIGHPIILEAGDTWPETQYAYDGLNIVVEGD